MSAPVVYVLIGRLALETDASGVVHIGLFVHRLICAFMVRGVSKEKRRRAVAALVRRSGAMIPVCAGEKRAEEITRERRGLFIEWHREE